MKQNLSTGTWASIDAGCRMRGLVQGGDLVNLVIGDDDQSVELAFNAEGARRLADIATRVVREMAALKAADPAADHPGTRIEVTDGVSAR